MFGGRRVRSRNQKRNRSQRRNRSRNQNRQQQRRNRSQRRSRSRSQNRQQQRRTRRNRRRQSRGGGSKPTSCGEGKPPLPPSSGLECKNGIPECPSGQTWDDAQEECFAPPAAATPAAEQQVGTQNFIPNPPKRQNAVEPENK